MTTTILCLLATVQSPNAVLARFAPAMKALSAFEVKFQFRGGRGDVAADVLIQKGKSLRFDAAANTGDNFTLSVSPAGYIELERKQKVYEKFAYPGGIAIYPARISALGGVFPKFLQVGSLNQMFPGTATVRSAGTEVLNGQVCDKVSVQFKGAMGDTSMAFSISRAGLIYYYRVIGKSMQGTIDQTWRVLSYTKYPSIPQSRFDAPVPDGFMPFALPDRVYPATVDEPLNLKGWVDSRTGAKWQVPAHKPVLFLLTSPDSMPGERAVKALRSWKAELEQKGVVVVVGSDAASRGEASGRLINPDGKSRAAMSVPATPMFFLVDAGGKLRNLWMGIAPGKEKTMESDVLQAVSKLK